MHKYDSHSKQNLEMWVWKLLRDDCNFLEDLFTETSLVHKREQQSHFKSSENGPTFVFETIDRFFVCFFIIVVEKNEEYN